MQVTTISVGVELVLTPEAEAMLTRIESARDNIHQIGVADPALPEALAVLHHIANLDHGIVDRIDDDGYCDLADKIRAFRKAVAK